MKIHRLPFSQIPQLSKRDRAYNNGSSTLKDFYAYEVTEEAFGEILSARKNYLANRKLLVEVLESQYGDWEKSPVLVRNLEALNNEDCFTVITAHQPSLFTGPLYFIYKIISTIQLAKRLNASYPSYQIVPVFVLGGEDHDFKEINHMHLFGKRLAWQNEESGAVGMMKTESLKAVLGELENILGEGENARAIFQLIHQSHSEQALYGAAVRRLVHLLFHEQGLVVVSMNDARLKKQFAPLMKSELLERPSQELIGQAAVQLSTIGFKQQAIAREINLFYLKDQLRERIVLQGDHYKVLNSSYQFTEAELLKELSDHPERFSPNVVMRPLYQEFIFPNLAYIGGGGELAYWMERKAQFEHFGIHFPMLVRRNSVLWLDRGMYKKIQKLGLQADQLFQNTDHLIKEYVQSKASIEVSFDDEKEQLQVVFEALSQKAGLIDTTLVKAVRAEQSKQLKAVEQLEARLLRAEKKKHEIAINQIRGLKDKLFPDNGLQERHDNFLNFYLKYGDRFFKILHQALDPLEKGFVIIEDDGSKEGHQV